MSFAGGNHKCWNAAWHRCRETFTDPDSPKSNLARTAEESLMFGTTNQGREAVGTGGESLRPDAAARIKPAVGCLETEQVLHGEGPGHSRAISMPD